MSSTTSRSDQQATNGQSADAAQAQTLAIDIGGTGLKASVLNEQGELITERVRVATPRPCPPAVMVETLAALVGPLPRFDRVSVGFPGVVRRGKILTAHNLGQEEWNGFDLREALEKQWGKPVLVKNDADLQGLAAIRGEGVEVVITLGTGVGSALFDNGWIAPHVELAHHPLRKNRTYEDLLGDRALERAGRKKWNKRVKRMIETLRRLTTFDRLYLGGGNSKKIDFALPPDVEIIPNLDGMRGGIWLWRKDRTRGAPPEED